MCSGVGDDPRDPFLRAAQTRGDVTHVTPFTPFGSGLGGVTP